MIDPITAFGVARGVLSMEVPLYAEHPLHKPVPVIPARRKLRILALHGFGQSGEYLRIALKTRQLTSYLTEMLDSDMLSQYDGVEWLCPDGPVKLLPDVHYDDPVPEDVAMRAWWRVLEFHIQQDQLYPSLRYLCDYIRAHGPVDGIVGFSQGACIGMMLAALCEGTPKRMTALSTQGSPLSLKPPQERFKFTISCCGFQSATAFYNGFYNPKIRTPSLHVVAEFDTMVSAERSRDLAEVCEDATVVRFRGTHHVPTDRASLYEMARFVADACSEKAPPERVGYVLPLLDTASESKGVAGVTVVGVEMDGAETPLSSISLSPPSSLSEYSSVSRRSRVRVIERRSTFRRIPGRRR